LKSVIIIAIVLVVIGILIFYSYQSLEEPIKVVELNLDYESGGTRMDLIDNSEIFTKYAYMVDWLEEEELWKFIHYEPKPQLEAFINDIGGHNDNQKTVFVIPVFTTTAYWDPGFYTYFRGDCDESCLTKKIGFELPFIYQSSNSAIKILRFLGYDYITDIEIDKNPEILKNYDKIILLHNEYVTQREFDAITSHPKVVYLYPNALYAEISVDYDSETITLVRGHGYQGVSNAFDWEFDNTHPDEFDNECKNWKFNKISNGIQLNCYPENVLYKEITLLKAIKDF